MIAKINRCSTQGSKLLGFEFSKQMKTFHQMSLLSNESNSVVTKEANIQNVILTKTLCYSIVFTYLYQITLLRTSLAPCSGYLLILLAK